MAQRNRDATSVEWLNNAISLVPADKLDRLAEQHAQEYQTAEPFPHIVIDSLFDEEVLDTLLAAYPTPDAPFWHRYDAAQEIKIALEREDAIPIQIRLFLYFLNGSIFINFLEQITGISGLIADPHLRGGGLHQIERGGMLAVHADFNKNERLNLDRRLNLLLYLNRDWRPEYGGDLELWDKDMTRCVRKVAPAFNRTVVFSTTDYSYHGHPDPLACPKDRTRRSLALYYYSNGRPDEERSDHHSTLWASRPGETFKGKLRHRLRRYVPPVVYDIYHGWRGV